MQLEYNPSYLNFPGEGDIVRYQEGTDTAKEAITEGVFWVMMRDI